MLLNPELVVFDPGLWVPPKCFEMEPVLVSDFLGLPKRFGFESGNVVLESPAFPKYLETRFSVEPGFGLVIVDDGWLLMALDEAGPLE